MKNILTIMRKEFARFFYDSRMIIMVIIPAVLIYVVYSFMGTAMQTAFAPDEEKQLVVYVYNLPDSISNELRATDIDVSEIDAGSIELVQYRITNQEVLALMVFPADFDALVAEYDVQTAAGAPAPNIEIYFNSVNTTSVSLYWRLVSILDMYEESLANKFDINRGIYDADLATIEDRTATMVASLMPMLLMIFLYSGCMGLALESITGEKERGTLATLLVSPLKRRELAIGKILSLAVLSFLSGALSAFATILALPNLMGAGGDIDAVGIYSITDYILLAVVILSTLLLMVAMISILSAFAKTVKEAGSYATPLMIVVMLVGVSGMFGGGAQENALFYLIPLYGSVQSMMGIFSLNYSITNIVISSVSTISYAAIGGFVLTKMFNSEKVMFSR